MTSFASNTRLTHRADRMHNSFGSNTTSMPSNWVLSSTGSNGGVVWTPAGGGVGTHNLLSLTHPDTTPASVSRGDMVAASSNASWKRMASPSPDAYTSDRFLGTLNDDPHWRARYYGVDALTSSSSNTFRGQVDLRAGEGIGFSVSSNTVTMSVLGAVTGDTAIAYSSGDVTTTSSLQDITGCSVSLTAGTWIVGAIFDTLVNNALNDRTFEGHLDSGGADQTNFAPLVAGTLLNDRWPVSQQWRLTLSATTTVKLRAKHSGGTNGDFTVKAQSVIAAWLGGSPGGGAPAITVSENFLTSPVTMSSINTFFDGPSLSLAAGTYLLDASVTIDVQTAAHFTFKIWDGTNLMGPTIEDFHATNGGQIGMSIHGYAVLAGTTTVKVSVAANNGTTNKIDNTGATNSTANKSSYLRATKIA